MNAYLDIPHLPQLCEFHKQMNYLHYNSMMIYYEHQNHLLHLPTLHHLFVQALNEISLRQDTKVLFQININTKDIWLHIHLLKWRDKPWIRKKSLPLVLESGYHLDNILMKLLSSFAIVLVKIIPLWMSDHPFIYHWKQDDLLTSLYHGLFQTIHMGIDHLYKLREIFENLHLFRRSL